MTGFTEQLHLKPIRFFFDRYFLLTLAFPPNKQEGIFYRNRSSSLSLFAIAIANANANAIALFLLVF